MTKYETYRSMFNDLNKSMRDGFYYQAVFLEYAVLEDRLTSVLKHANVKYMNKKGREINISDKISRISKSPELSSCFVQSRLTPELLEDLTKWLKKRNDLVHNLAKLPYNNEQVKLTAEEGYEICKIIKNRSGSIVRHFSAK